MATRRLWREALQLSKVFRSGTASGLTYRCVGSSEAVLYIRCVSNFPQYCPPSSVGCYFSAQDRDGGTERDWRKRALFASLGVLSLTLCSSVREDGTSCSTTGCTVGWPFSFLYLAFNFLISFCQHNLAFNIIRRVTTYSQLQLGLLFIASSTVPPLCGPEEYWWYLLSVLAYTCR